MRLDETVFEVQPYLDFRGFRKFKNKNASLGPFSEYEQQRFATSRTGLRAIPQEVRGDERTIEVAPTAMFMQRKVKHTKYDFFCGGPLIIHGFSLFAGWGVGT